MSYAPSRFTRAAAALAALLAAAYATAEEALVLLAQPLPREERASEGYASFAAYLETIAGRRVTVHMPPGFPGYWEAVRRHRYDLAFDAPHFTDYRLQKRGFMPLVKAADTATYSLVVRRRENGFDPLHLVGKRVASLGLLGIGTLRLNALFPDALRQPVVVETHSTEESLRLLRHRRVEAAFLPTAALDGQLPDGSAIVLTTEPMPRLGLSASPDLAPELAQRIREGLLRAHETENGRAMLQALGFERFEAAYAGDFLNHSYVLRQYWGY